jgi:Pyruvate/2-oxoacid:ferredoxin oxidoreductase delta subunit
MRRKIVKIDADKCTGCEQCVHACAEGAIKMIDGKARLVSDSYCDGLGACLGECPAGAITIEEREADAFDEQAAAGSTGFQPVPHGTGSTGLQPMPTKTTGKMPVGRTGGTPVPREAAPLPCGCPGTMAKKLRQSEASASPAGDDQPSRLGNWPVQLRLIPPTAPYLKGADLLVAADCVAFAYPNFHSRLLAGKVLIIACPKLDDPGPQVAKLTEILAGNDIHSVTVVHMEVPCCTGIVRAVHAALAAAGKTDLPFEDVTIGIDGAIRR